MQRLVVTDALGATRAIARGLDRALGSGMKVLWLISGGSNIPIELNVLAKLQHATPQNLTISLLDERFVEQTSPDSNWHVLVQDGLDGTKARLEPPITDATLDLTAAADDFASRLQAYMQTADAIIGQFGVGTDGHTAGILPHSVGVHETTRLVVGYEAPDFKRLTTTPALFSRLDIAIVVAMGPSKRSALLKMSGKLSPDDQPVQLLRETKESIVYTDQQIE